MTYSSIPGVSKVLMERIFSGAKDDVTFTSGKMMVRLNIKDSKERLVIQVIAIVGPTKKYLQTLIQTKGWDTIPHEYLIYPEKLVTDSVMHEDQRKRWMSLIKFIRSQALEHLDLNKYRAPA